MRNGPTPDEADISTAKAIWVLVIALVLFGLTVAGVIKVIRWLW